MLAMILSQALQLQHPFQSDQNLEPRKGLQDQHLQQLEVSQDQILRRNHNLGRRQRMMQ